MQFRPTFVHGAVATLFDPQAEEEWRKRDTRKRNRHQRVLSVERRIEEMNRAIRGRAGRTIALWSGLLGGLALVVFGVLGGI